MLQGLKAAGARVWRWGLLGWMIPVGLYGQMPAPAALTAVELMPGVRFQRKVVKRYQVDPTVTAVWLQMKYAEATILNPEEWDSTRKDRVPVAVELLYSQYPVDTTDWIRPFGRLMRARVANLQALDRRFADPRIRWTLVAQTDCRSEAQAVQLLHGFVVRYRVDPKQAVTDPETLIDMQYDRVKRLIGGGLAFRDSVVFQVMERHPDWKNMAVVMDWTGSMYPYGASAIRYHMLHPEQRRIAALLVFNDGDDFLHKGRRHKVLGRAGGIYEADPSDMDEILVMLKVAMQRGDGAEPEENNVEALLYAQRRYPDAERLVLIADNHSPVRDLALAARLYRPVDIVLCGTRVYPTHPDYVTLAWQTGGTLQTLEGEYVFREKRAPVPAGGFAIGRQRYVLRGERFVAVTGEPE